MTKPLKDVLLAGLAKSQRNLQEAQDNLSLGHFDNSVSCSYYAAFTAARTALLSLNIEPKTHEGVRSMFALHFVKTGIFSPTASRSLSDLKGARESGDYDFFSGISKEEATDFLSDAKKFVAEADAYLQKRFADTL